MEFLENNKISFVIKKVSTEEYENLINGGFFEIERIDVTKENGKKTSEYLLLSEYQKGKKFSNTKLIK